MRGPSLIGSLVDYPVSEIEIDPIPELQGWPTPEQPMPVEEDEDE